VGGLRAALGFERRIRLAAAALAITGWPAALGAQVFEGPSFDASPTDSVLVEQPAQVGEHHAAVGDAPSTDWSAWASGSAGGTELGQGEAATICEPMDAAPCPQPCHAHDGCINRYLNRVLGPACPRWVLQVDALMLWQGNLTSQPLLHGPAAVTVLDANQAGTPLSSGPRAGLIFNLDDCYSIEGNYFNVGTFNGNVAVPAGDYTSLVLPTAFTPEAGSTSTLVTAGRIQSAELNWRRRECCCPITWLAGFRWVQWDQSLALESVPSAVGSVQRIDADTDNDLYGGQIGADLNLWNAGGRLTVNGISKAGVFYNDADQRTAGIDAIGAAWGPAIGNADRVAFFGEVGAYATLAVTRWLAWRTGYSCFWLGGVAVPANQLAFVDPTVATAPINTSGSVFLHGVSTGLEARW
jgi:hypothetical protein